MSSLRNSLHRRNHKERSQLAHRARLGILEKHKDYVLRARDYHSKQERLTRLRQKAAERNKDEFYFGMNGQRTQRGVHVQERGNTALPVDIVKVLKTQDENYLRTMRTAGLKKIDKLKSQLTALADLVKPGLLDDDMDDDLDEGEIEVLRESGILPAPNPKRRGSALNATANHLVFADNEEEARQYASQSRNHGEDAGDMDIVLDDQSYLGWKAPDEKKKNRRRSRHAEENVLEDKNLAELDRKEAASQHRTKLLKELSARLFRDRQLRYAERELEMQRLLMGKGASRKLHGVEKVGDDDQEDDDEDEDQPRGGARKKVDEKTWKPRVYKWRVERKR